MIDFEFWDVSVATPATVKKVNTRLKYAKLFFINYFILLFVLLVMFVIFPFASIPEGQTRRLPLAIYFPWDMDKSPLHEVLAVVLTWNMIISVFGNILFDFFFLYVTQQLCNQFVLLKDLLQNLTHGIMMDKDDIEKFNSGLFQKTVAKRLKICVRHHNLLLRCGAELTKICSPLFGLQVILTYIGLAIEGFVLMDNDGDPTKSVSLVAPLMGLLAEFWIFAVQSTMLQQESMTIPEAIAKSNWYLIKAPQVRDLAMVVMNSRTGIVMLGAGMIEVNNELIVIVMQRVFSAITLLQTLMDH